MLDRPLHCDRRLLNMLLATLLVAPLSLAAQERDQAVDKPATKTGKAAPQDARPSDNPAALFDRLDRNNDGVLVADEIPEPQAKAFGRLIRIGDRNKDGRLTRQEFLSSLEPDRPATSDRRRPGQGRSVDPAQSFDRFDKNKDGKLTLDEFPAGVRERIAALLKQSGKDSMNREDFAKLYRSREVGNQGKKTRKRPESPRVQQPANDRARREQFFDRLDRNKDGQLTELEFPESSRGLFTFLARRLGKKPGESISRKEFIESLPSQRTGRSRPDQPGPERPRPGQPGERPRPDAPREAGRGPAIFRVLDLNRDGRISREELAKAAAQFEQLDTNRDGQLDPREFFGTRGSGERPPLRPDAGPGQRPEARPGVRPQPPPRRPETTRGNDRPRTTRGQTTDRRLFERLDRDGNGRIEASEVPALLRDRLKRLDTNGDGRISPEEFSRGLKEGNQRLRERPPLPRRQPRERPRDEE